MYKDAQYAWKECNGFILNMSMGDEISVVCSNISVQITDPQLIYPINPSMLLIGRIKGTT